MEAVQMKVAVAEVVLVEQEEIDHLVEQVVLVEQE
jgi:hypothetical protein